MVVPVGNGDGTILYKTEFVRIWVNGVELTYGSDFTVARETGVITFAEAPDEDALIQAACKFFVLMHGQDKYSPQMTGDVWKFPSGATLFQVASEVASSGIGDEGGGS